MIIKIQKISTDKLKLLMRIKLRINFYKNMQQLKKEINDLNLAEFL